VGSILASAHSFRLAQARMTADLTHQEEAADYSAR